MKELTRLGLPLLLLWLLRAGAGADGQTPSPNRTLEEEADGHQTWESLQRLLKKVVDEIIKRALPMVTGGRGKLDLSAQCTGSMMQLIFDLRQTKLWAWQMVDAMGKPSPGLLKGSLALTGSYEQCLDIELRKSRRKFKGQYCTLDFSPILPPKPKYIPMWNHTLLETQPESPNIPISARLATLNQYFYIFAGKFGLCLPSACKNHEVQQIVNTVLESIKLKARVVRCETKQEVQISKEQIIVICALALFLLLVMIGTVFDCLDHRKQQFLGDNKGKIQDMVICFSVRRSLKTLLAEPSIAHFSPLHGMHFITIIWITIGLTYRIYQPQYMRKMLNLESDSTQFYFQIIQTARTGFNTFYFLSGLLTAYTALKSYQEKKFNYVMFILQRYLRLTVWVTTSLCFIVLCPLFGSGPLWRHLVQEKAQICRDCWWTYVLYVSNWMKHEDMCTYAFQYASTIFQLHLISLFVIISLRWTKFGILIILALTVGSIGCIAFFTYWQELFITATKLYEPDFQKTLFEYVSLQTYTHLGPYCVGILTGYALVRYDHIKIDKLYRGIGWTVAVILSLMVVFYSYVSHHRNQPIIIESVFTSSFHRILWSLALAWITFSCVKNHSGAISQFLSFRMFIPLSRISHLGLFLLEYIIQIRFGMMQNAFVYSKYNMMYEIFGHLILLVVTATIGYVLIEAPINALQYKIFPSYWSTIIDTKEDTKPFPPKVQLKAVSALDRNV